ncbi:hypothetical protein Tco_1287105, partial [Tanacetum coccineum]
MEPKDTLSSCSDVEEKEIQQLQMQANILKENSINKFNPFKTTTQRFERQNFTTCPLFQQAFAHLFSKDVRAFKFELSQNMQNLERQLNKETLHEKVSKSDLTSDASLGDKDSSEILSDKGNDQSLKNQSNTSGDESSTISAEYNVFAIETQHSEQPKSINNTYVMEKNDSNVILDSSNVCDNDNQVDQNAEACDDERVALANLIANLKLDIDENKKIQKKLKKENASLTQELKECQSNIAETNRTL